MKIMTQIKLSYTFNLNLPKRVLFNHTMPHPPKTLGKNNLQLHPSSLLQNLHPRIHALTIEKRPT